MTALEKALANFLSGPAILGIKKPGDWNIVLPKTQTVNGVTYRIVWVSPQTSKKITELNKLESVDGGIVYRIKSSNGATASKIDTANDKNIEAT